MGDNTWNTTYVSNDGDELDVDVFYATYQNQLWVRTLQVNLFIHTHLLHVSFVLDAERDVHGLNVYLVL